LTLFFRTEAKPDGTTKSVPFPKEDLPLQNSFKRAWNSARTWLRQPLHRQHRRSDEVKISSDDLVLFRADVTRTQLGD
jgi:hypothetical protein